MPSDEDPYAKYLTPPSGAAPATAVPADGADPYAKYLTPPGGTPGAAASQPPSSGGPLTDTALSFLDHLGMGLGTKNPFMAMPDQLKQDVAQAHSNLGAWDYPVGMAAYMLGPGKIFGPAGAAIGGTGVLGTAAESALAGGAHNAIQSNLDPEQTAWGAAGGLVLGGAAGALTKGANAGLQAAFGKTASVDPAAAIASTKGIEGDAYTALRQAQINPSHVDSAISNVMSNLDPSVETGMSPGLKSQINDISSSLQNQKQVNGNQVNSWQRQINEAAQRNRYPTDSIVAGKISDGLDGVLQANGAGDLNAAAKQASQQRIMAENLAEWQRKAAAGAPLGQAPLSEAENWYQGQPQYDDLVNLYKQSASQQDPSWALGHMAAGAVGDIGGAMFGFPGHFAGEALGYLGIKPAIKGAFKGMKQNAVGKSIQQLYPGTTGVQPTGGVQAPQVGDMIKNLMLGSAY